MREDRSSKVLLVTDWDSVPVSVTCATSVFLPAMLGCIKCVEVSKHNVIYALR